MADLPSFDQMPIEGSVPPPMSPQQQAAPLPSFDQMSSEPQAPKPQAPSDPGEQAIAGIEGVARGLLGPIPGAIEKYAMRIPEKEILARQENYPVTSGIGEAGGLLAGALTGTGEAAALEAIGKGAAKAAGLGEATGYAARVGSSIVKNAAEMAAYQSQDEVGRAILNDPSTGAESAIAHIGLATALGGVGGGLITGVASPLWHATKGSEIAGGLKALVSRWGGVEGDQAMGAAATMANKAGVEIPPEVRAVLEDRPGAREAHSQLSQDDSKIAGRSYQKSLQKLDNDMGTGVAESLGKTAEDIEGVPEKNNYETGQTLGETLHKELKPVVDDISNRYEKVTEKFKSKPILPDSMSQMGDEMSQKAINEGWHKVSDDANMKLVNKTLHDLPKQTSIDDIKKYITNLYRPYDAPDFRAAIELKKILSKGLETAISVHMEPGELASYGKLRQDYAELSKHLENLDTHLHLGKWGGPQTFLDALKEKAGSKGESLLANMTGKNNAALLDLLQVHPNTLAGIADHYKNTLIRSAKQGAAPGELLKTSRLLREIKGMSPQQRALIATPEQHARIEAINEIKQGLIDPTHNFSNTARTIQKHMSGAVSPLSLIAIMLGHGDAGLLGYLGPMGLAEARSGLKLATLKFLGNSKPVDAAGFAAAAEYYHEAQKAANVLNKAAENVFKPGTSVLLQSQLPAAHEIAKLDKLVASNDPKTTDRIMASAENGHVGHYLPQEQAAMTQTSMAAYQYLKSIRPQPTQLNPLDKPIPPTPTEEAKYHRALEIAQQPAIVMQDVKDGTVQVSDLQHLKAMYPAVYGHMAQKLSNEMINRKSEDGHVPYKTRMGISLFLGQPMDATMQPLNIQAAQPAPKNPPPQNGPKMGKKGSATLGKSNKEYRTQTQEAEADRGNRND